MCKWIARNTASIYTFFMIFFVIARFQLIDKDRKFLFFIKNVYIMPHNAKISPNTYLIIYMRKFMTFLMLALFGSIFFFIRNVDYYFFLLFLPASEIE